MPMPRASTGTRAGRTRSRGTRSGTRASSTPPPRTAPTASCATAASSPPTSPWAFPSGPRSSIPRELGRPTAARCMRGGTPVAPRMRRVALLLPAMTSQSCGTGTTRLRGATTRRTEGGRFAGTGRTGSGGRGSGVTQTGMTGTRIGRIGLIERSSITTITITSTATTPRVPPSTTAEGGEGARLSCFEKEVRRRGVVDARSSMCSGRGGGWS
mmetsp:Transcript_36363/g.74621  ORF Transcript_36363/g.74621 Transcript_36363/m.74621 type:complete len:213 (-) Transcript_36363:46-684(-)